MDKITESVKDIPNESISFFQYIFQLNQDNKNEIMNIIQYSLLSIIPIMVILKTVKHFIPEDDESKGSLEILGESIGQIFFMILALWFTNRIIRYIPTYSEEEYTKYNPVNYILPLLLILLTMQTKLGTKLNILADRVSEYLGYSQELPVPQKKNSVKVTQPISQPNSQPISHQPDHQPSRADQFDKTSLLPTSGDTQFPSQHMQNTQQNALNASQPPLDLNVMNAAPEPMAANSFGGSSW